MGFCQWAEMGPKVGQKWGFWEQKWVKLRQNPLLHPLETHYGIVTKTHPLPSLREVETVFQKGPEAVPTQHKPREARRT